MGSGGYKPFWRKILPWFLVVLFVCFFVGGPEYHSPRLFKAIWNLGHILFFALLPILFFNYRKWLSDRFSIQGLIVLGTCLVLGVLIELFQYDFQRTPDAGDVCRDVIGGLVGVFFLLGSRKSLRAKILTVFQIITVGLVGLQVYPVFTALADEYLSTRQFPVLSGFETPWEIARWDGGAAIAVDCSVHREGKCSLRVQLGTERYSGISLVYFPHNWEGAKGFRFCVFNPLKEVISLTCRIHDQQHENGLQLFTDRFNRRYELPSGWNTVEIDARDILNAPKERQMDMGHIAGVGIFATKLPQPQVVYFDDVKLEF
jgi:VanZ family protein